VSRLTEHVESATAASTRQNRGPVPVQTIRASEQVAEHRVNRDDDAAWSLEVIRQV
jgi:hypothetical protein